MPANPFRPRARENSPRRIVITGASSGLGRALAINYAAPEVSLALVGRDATRLSAAAAACQARGASVCVVQQTVTECAALARRLRAFDADAPVDLVIASAGVLAGPPHPAALEGLDAAGEVIGVNLLGLINTVEALAGALTARRAGQIAILASTAAYRGLPYLPAYCASKAGVRAYGEAVRARLAPFGVKVSVIVPSFFESPMTDTFAGPTPMIIPLEAAARRVRKGLDRAAPRIVFPRRMGLLMQLMDLLPARLGDRALQSDVRIRRSGGGAA